MKRVVCCFTTGWNAERAANRKHDNASRVFYLCNVMVSETNSVHSACFTIEKCWSRERKIRKSDP